MSANPKQSMTAEEYLAFERANDQKHEFIHGDVRYMNGAKRSHCLVVGHLIAEFGNQLETSASEVYASQMRVKANGSYLYPDVVVVTDKPIFEDKEKDTLLNPTLVVEVFSSWSEVFDRGVKFHHDRTLPSLQDYVLIAQDAMWLESIVVWAKKLVTQAFRRARCNRRFRVNWM